jgi:gamma-glutamyl-gamma-aminobutyraldehyde dehydrogenase
LAELALEAGLPPGVLNVVPGYGHEAGEALALHPEVDAIGFTGSTRVGRRMLNYAADSNLKRVYNELGGKSAFIVFDDVKDLDRAVRTAAASVFFNQGESCNAPTRVLVHGSQIDEALAILRDEASAWQPGDPLDEATRLGAVVDEGQLRTVLRYIDLGVHEGATLAHGGRQTRTDTGGHYVEPTILANAHNGMAVAREEIFGPVLTLIPFHTEAEAISLANDSPYGLQASLWSGQLDRVHRVARALQAGTVHVNQYDEDDITVPFGGVKQSGNGRDKSLHAFDKYTELKTTWVRIDA